MVNCIFTALAVIAGHYVEALNTPGTVPNIQKAWDMFVTTKCTEAQVSTFKLYSENMTEHLDGKLPCDDEEIAHRHDTALQQAQQKLEEEVYRMKSASVEKYLTALIVSTLMIFNCAFSREKLFMVR